MDLEIRLFGPFRDAVGQRTLARSYVEAPTVRTVFRDLEGAYPALADSLLDADGERPPSVAVVLNGRNIVHEAGLDTTLSDGDVVGITPPLAGGSDGG